MELETKITIFETGVEEGIFSRNEKFYPPNFTENDRLEITNFLNEHFIPMTSISFNDACKRYYRHELSIKSANK